MHPVDKADLGMDVLMRLIKREGVGLCPRQNIVPVSTLVIAPEVRPRLVVVLDPLEPNDAEVRLALERKAERVYAVI
jgi:hypothetical protein